MPGKVVKTISEWQPDTFLLPSAVRCRHKFKVLEVLFIKLIGS